MTTVALVGRLRRLPRWRTLIALAVIALVVAGVWTGVRRASSSPPQQQSKASDNRTLLSVLSGLDPAVVQSVGDGGLAGTLVAVKNQPALLGAAKRPQVVFMATEGCGICAAQRWSMVIALTRFGTVKDLLLALSSVGEGTGPLVTFSFRNLQYTSAYIDVVAIETADPNGNPLTTLSAADQQVVDRYDAPPYVPEALRRGVPWLDVANEYVMPGSGYPASLLKGLNWGQIGEKLSDAKDPVTRGIVGNANWITAAICQATGGKPASVCAAAPIKDLAGRLG